MRGKTGAVRGMYGANRGKIGVKTGLFANFPASAIASAAAKMPQNAPGALQTRPRPPKKRPKIRPSIKNIFWIFWIFSAVALPPSPPPRRTRACPSSAAPAHHRIPRVAGGGRYGRNSRVIIFFLPRLKSTHPAESIARSATGISSRVVSRILRHGLSLGSGRANSA